MRRGDREDALRRFEGAVEVPLLVLAVAMVPLLVLPLAFDLSDRTEATFLALDWFIWAAFAAEYVVRLILAPARWQFVRTAWLDLLMVALPFLRPLRVVRSTRALRLLRVGRLATVLGVITKGTRRLLVAHQLQWALLITIVVATGAALAVHAAEAGTDGPIDSFGDALWWSVATITTVGYGDTYPTTPTGRGIATFLMIAGIAFFGVLTANVAAFFIESDQTSSTDEKLDEILRRLERLEQRNDD